MSYQTSNTVTSASKVTLFDVDVDGVGPLEWTIETDEEVELYFTGVWPGVDIPVTLTAGSSKTFLSTSRGIQKIEAQASSSTAAVIITPSIF